MTATPHRTTAEVIQEGVRVLREEARAILELADRLDERFCQAVERLAGCTGAVIVSGMGKAGLIGRKFSATLSSTGTRSFFLHPGEALHGDLGCLDRGDVVVIFSNSGETGEVVNLLSPLAKQGQVIIAITQCANSTLGRSASLVIELGRISEACRWGLIPTCSAAVMMALGDAIALAVSDARGFTPTHFEKVHPGGSLGRFMYKARRRKEK